MTTVIGALSACPLPADATVEEARPCEANADCDDGGLCHFESGRCGRNDCDVVGDACDGTTFCTGGACERTCEAPVARGERCLLGPDEGGACDFAATCAAGLVCAVVGSEWTFGDCAPPTDRADGEVCGDDVDACGAGLRCDGVYCQPAR